MGLVVVLGEVDGVECEGSVDGVECVGSVDGVVRAELEGGVGSLVVDASGVTGRNWIAPYP